MQTERHQRVEDDTVVQMRNVEVSYNMPRGRARVLNDVDLDIKRGETLGIVGESGSGKSMCASTLMNAVEDPGVTTGEILYNPPDREPVDILDVSKRQLKLLRWEEIAMVHQGAMNAFNPTLSIRRHFLETFDAHNVDTDDGFERAEEVFSQLNLEAERILDSYGHELSGGEKHRALLALALVFSPEVLILDEPTSSLDLLTQRNLLSTLLEVKEEYDLTLVFISHDIPVISGIADRLAVMYAFEIAELGQAREVILEPEHPYTRLMLSATLDLDKSYDETNNIAGQTPDPINVPSGCSFHPRCPIADDRCEVEDPHLQSEQESDHEVACFYPDVAVDSIDTIFDEGVDG